MFTTFDRYLLGRLLHTFGVFFIAAYGLFVVIDLFMNVDDFQNDAAGLVQVGGSILEYYTYRCAEFFEIAGPVLIVISVITVLGLLQKNSETYPILAAGIPAFRLLKPLLIAAAILNVLLIVNQEFIIPSIAVQLQTARGSSTAKLQKVEPVYDFSNHLMHIDGEFVKVEEQKLLAATFTLPAPELSTSVNALTAEYAVYMDAADKRPAGWMLKNLTGVFDSDILTEEGRRRVIPHPNGRDLFIVSAVSFDQLYNRGRNLKLLSSSQLVQRIRNPSTGLVPVRGQSLALHSRITRPLLCLISITIALPLVMKKESRSLIMNMAVCAGVQGFFYGVTQGCFALGSTGAIAPDLAAWLPVIVCGIASTWTAGYVQT
ncbi:MAG: LptF/LptG family permease [Planctomycetaceae bacterium]|nr:LptF/LptG family permease [Planctomycetaceae bacterium]